MKASELIIKLSGIISVYGNLPIVGGNVSDDTIVTTITVVDEDGCDVTEQNTQPVGIFLQ